jgi:type I restriction enzyme S subunit
MRTKNIQVDLEDDDLVYIPKAIASEEKLLIPGDILVSSANSWNLVGKCCWIPSLSYMATFGGFTSVLRPISTKVFPRYLYHWFSTERVQRLARSFGQQTTNISNLNHSRCLELQIPLPPLDEQRRIAAILDKADALRRKRKRAIELLDGLTQSIFLEMFGDPAKNPKQWPMQTLGGLVSNESNKRVPLKSADRDKRDGPYPYYGASGIIDHIDGYLFDGRRLLIAEDGANLLSRSTPVAFFAEGKFWVNNHAHVLAAGPSCNLSFLRSFIEAIDLTPYVTGSAQPKLNRANLDKIAVPTPPLDLQRLYQSRIEQSEALFISSELAKRNGELLFSSLQHRAFSGQL